jgi:hypothetical protein
LIVQDRVIPVFFFDNFLTSFDSTHIMQWNLSIASPPTKSTLLAPLDLTKWVIFFIGNNKTSSDSSDHSSPSSA